MYFVWGTLYADELILERFGLRHTKYMGHPPCNLADKRVYIFQNSEGWQIYFDTGLSPLLVK